MSKYTSMLENTFLFRGIDQSGIERLLPIMETEERSYAKGETIYSPNDFERKLGFVIKGECWVGRCTGGNFIPLNVIEESGSFGVVAILSEYDSFPTTVMAKTSCTVLFISKQSIDRLMENDLQVTRNIVSFLARKINFLNDKLATFSGGCIEEKLAGYILSLKKKHGSLEFDFNKKKSAEALNCGRASLYRAIESLEADGIITVKDKKIQIIDPEGLERITK